MSHISPTTAELLSIEHVIPDQLIARQKLTSSQEMALAVIGSAWHDLTRHPARDKREEAMRFLADSSPDGPLAFWCAYLPGICQQAVVDRVRRLSGRLESMLASERA